MAMGAVQLQGGQTLVEFNVKVLDDAFLEPRANFFVSLNSTSLVGGGESSDNAESTINIGGGGGGG